MKRAVRFGVAISEELLGPAAPVLLQGGLAPAIRRAAELGFDAVEIHVRNPATLDLPSIADAAEEAGVAIMAVGTGLEYTLNGLSFTSEDPEVRRRTGDRFREHIALAARFGATVFVGLCRGVAPEASRRAAYLDRFARELLPVVRHAEERGVTLSLEPIASYMTNLLTTTREALAFLDRPGLEPVMLLMDTHHMFHEDGDLTESFRACRGRIAHLHISDSDRRFPGSGEIDYTAVGRVLTEIGYDRTVSLEVLPDPDGESAARSGLAWMHSVWGE